MKITRQPRKFEDVIFPEIYLSAWINHGLFGGFMYENTSISIAVLKFKIETCERPGKYAPGLDFWTPHESLGPPYIYAGQQKKWVWMEEPPNKPEIPFNDGGPGSTIAITIHGSIVYWQKPSKSL